jgi:hypothetical protein
VHVILLTTLYEIGEGCKKSFKNLTVIESSSEQAKITDLLPYSNYKLKILASNVYGKSNFSEDVFFTTKPARPTKPRDVEIKFDGDTKLTALITWKPPCFMNSVFSLYTVTINGNRKGLKNHKETKASSIPALTVDDVKLGYKYDVEIQAVNQNDAFGDVLKYSFVAPSGSELKYLVKMEN